MEAGKPFKDTAVGKFLAEKAPKILTTVGDILPNQGVLGIIKNLIPQDEKMTPEEKAQALKLVQDYELEVFSAEASDRASARNREVMMNGHNLTQNILAYVGVIGFFIIVAFILAKGLGEMTNQASFIVGSLVGVAGGVFNNIYGYYFGSSIGSKAKEDILDKKVNQ